MKEVKVNWTQDSKLIQKINNLILKNPHLPLLSDPKMSHPIIQAIDIIFTKLEQEKELLLPNLTLNNETICVFSDYSGESPDALFNTYSFLFTDYGATHFFPKELKKVREKNGLTAPWAEICFKNLRMGQISRSLAEWLRVGDFINGLLLTIIIDKDIISFIGENSKEGIKELAHFFEENGLGTWKPKVSEKALRIVSPIAYGAKLLSIPGQKFFWMTDRDSIAANETIAKSIGSIYARTIEYYTSNNWFKKIGYATEFEGDDYESRMYRDLLSYPDLVAGSVERFFSNRINPHKVPLKEEAHAILLWLEHHSLLKKWTIWIRRAESGDLKPSIVKFHPDDPLKQDLSHVAFVPIFD